MSISSATLLQRERLSITGLCFTAKLPLSLRCLLSSICDAAVRLLCDSNSRLSLQPTSPLDNRWEPGQINPVFPSRSDLISGLLASHQGVVNEASMHFMFCKWT